jgi:hypothetical protein
MRERAVNAELHFKGALISYFVLRKDFTPLEYLNFIFITDFEVFVVIIYFAFKDKKIKKKI